MSTFKVQRIRSCVQCGTVLGLKCRACSKHPDRKPKVVEIYDWPPILETCPSGDCVKIACQRDECHNTMWRNRTHTRGGKMRSESMYCSRKCNCLVLAAARYTRVLVKCGWDPCKVLVPRKASQLKNFKSAYCRPVHYFLKLRKNAHDAKLEKEKDENNALLECRGKCRSITDHAMTSPGAYKCLRCGQNRRTRDTATPRIKIEPAVS